MISFDSLSQQSQGLENFTKRMGEITNMGTTLKSRMKPEFVSMFESRLQGAMSASATSKKSESVTSVKFDVYKFKSALYMYRACKSYYKKWNIENGENICIRFPVADDSRRKLVRLWKP